MESIIIVILFLASPFLVYGWIYGCTLIKKLLLKEWIPSPKDILNEYSRLSSEQRMELDINKIEKGTTQWIGSPATDDMEMKEGLHAPKETPPPLSRLP